MGRVIHQFRIGQIECTAVSDGYFSYLPPRFPRPAQILFANAPSDQLEDALREDGVDVGTWDEWTSDYTCLVLQTGEHVILVDTGAGSLGPHTGRLLENLTSAGISPDDINLVVTTHAHPDHVGGNTDDDGRCRFPKADWVISEREWNFWTAGEAERELPEHVRQVMLHFASRNLSPLVDRVRLTNGEEEIVPGVVAIPAPGHTPGQLALRVSSHGECLYCISDVVLHPLHVRRPEWVAIVDMSPTDVVTTRKALLERARDEGAVVMSFHFPFPGLGRVQCRGDGCEWSALEAN